MSRWLRITSFFGYVGLVTLASLWPRSAMPPAPHFFTIPHADKLIHLAMYTLMSALGAITVLKPRLKNWPLAAFLFACIYAFGGASTALIEATGSQVTHTSLKRTHATLTPDAALAVSGLLQNLSRSTTNPGFDVVPTLSTLHQWFTCVRLSVSHLTRSSPAFSLTLTTSGS